MKKLNISPVLKWAGGKRQLIKEIEKRLPKEINAYYEPFMGGGAVVMHLQPKNAIISDVSDELINVYKEIENNPLELIENLNKLEEKHSKNPEEHYYDIRALDRTDEYTNLDNSFKAARTIYLNKTCFNGLYRVNKKGYFNVPFNKKETINTYDKENLMNLSKYLNMKDVELICSDFEEVCKNAKKGDFLFLDPPYDVLKTDTFDSYTKDGFGVEGQKRLANLFKELDKRGCYLMLTNHNTELINELYKDYNIDVVSVKRMINSDAKNRKGEETIIYNYTLEE